MVQRLKEVLGDCKKGDCSYCEQKTSYHLTDKQAFFVYDDPGENRKPVRIVLEGECQLKIHNTLLTEICVVKTDQCLFADIKSKKCDCFIFNHKDFYLVEIKSVNAGKRAARRQQAIEQLKATLTYLVESGISNVDHNLHAVVCFGSPKTYPVQASRSLQKENFRKEFGASLVEANEIKFN